jgi:ABC-type spermidine/putrescine transport system permease subunit II
MLRHRYLGAHLTLTVLFGGFLMLIYSPMISVFVLSFQGEGGGLTFPLRGVSLHWFRSLFVEQQLAGNIWAALQRSLILGIVVAAVTFVVAFLAGLAFRRPFRGAVLVPVLAPSLAGVALLGLTLSYDEFSRSVLVMGTGNTLPLELFAMTTNITTPAIYALGTVTTVFSLAVLLAGGGAIVLLRKRRIGP